MHSIQHVFWRRAAIACALLLPAAAPAAPLTEAEALRRGLSHPELSVVASARLNQAGADVDAAHIWPNPTLELGREKTGAASEQSWQLSQPVDLSGRRALHAEAAEYRQRAVAAGNEVMRGARAAEILRLFHELLRQQEALRAMEGWAGRFDQVAIIIDKLARAGEASGYDRRRLQREQRAAEARVAETRGEIERARSRLAALVGGGLDDGVSGRLVPDAPAELGALRARLAERPDLTALAATAEAAEAENAAARRRLPELTVGVGGKRVDDGAVRETGTFVSVSIPLPIFERRQADDRRSTAQAAAARAELALARQQADGELLGRYRQLAVLLAAAARYRNEAVAPSAELVRIAETAYGAGESTLLELLDAYRGALDAELTALDLEWKARDARIELDQLIGTHTQ